MFPSEGQISKYSFRQRAESAARAGFKGIGLWHTDLEHTQALMSLKDMKKIMDDNGIQYLELEFLTDWFLDGPRKSESDRTKKLLFTASAELGAKHIKVGDFYGSPVPMSKLVDSFGLLCKEAESFEATIGFEFMKGNAAGTLAKAVELSTKTAAKNGGLILDIAHMVSLHLPMEDLCAVPLQYLISVELNDGLLPENPAYDGWKRNFCGQGHFDLQKYIQCVEGSGYSGPWALEVFNPDYLNIPLDELNRLGFSTTMDQFERIR